MARATGAVVPRGTVAAAGAVAARPSLWGAALRQARTLAPTGWWRRPPFLPVPDRAWMRFRLVTAYGDPDGPIDTDDLLTWLRWSDTVRPAPDIARRPDQRRR